MIAARTARPARLAAVLRRDRRVAYVERDPTLRLTGDGDFPDPDHGNVNFSWAFDAVRAGPALVAAGGGSSRSVAVIDTGVDVGHPDLAGRLGEAFDTASGGSAVSDLVGHGTFVAGLVSAVDGNGLGGKGVAGATIVLPVRASTTGDFTLGDVLRGLDFAIRRGADVINLSLAGDTFSASQARALATAFFNDVLPVAASGNRALDGNPIEFPAAFLGGRRGAAGHRAVGRLRRCRTTSRRTSPTTTTSSASPPPGHRRTAGAACSRPFRATPTRSGTTPRASATRPSRWRWRAGAGGTARARASPPRSRRASPRSSGRSSRSSSPSRSRTC